MRIYQGIIYLFEGFGGQNISHMVHDATLLIDFADDILDILGPA